MSSSVALAPAAAVVAVDVGKTTAALLVSDAQRCRLFGPIDFPMTATGLDQVIIKTAAVLPAGLIRVGVEAAGHYHRPLASAAVWPGWQVVELNPAHVSEQRRVMGRRRIKTDALDLEAITELLLAGRGVVVGAPSTVITELTGWAGLRRRRVAARVATKNQLLAQLDRCFPGLTLALPNVLNTGVGRLVAQEAARRIFAAKKKGAIVNIASVLGFGVAKGVAAYAVAKAGVVQLTKALALEWTFKGVRVNAIAPGWFVTEINEDYLNSEEGKAMTRAIPAGRFAYCLDPDGNSIGLFGR